MKIWQYHTTPIGNLYQECIDTFKGNLPKDVTQEMLSAAPFELINKGSARLQSDEIRYGLLADNANDGDAWIDSDIRCLEWWAPPADGKIYANDSFSVIFSNGNSAEFKKLFDAYKALPPKERIPGWISIYFRGKGLVSKIPEGKFQHLGLNMVKNLSYGLIANSECAVLRKPDGTLSFNWIKGKK